MTTYDPIAALASLRHEFGEHGGVNMSIEASSTFTVLEPGTMPELFQGRKGPDDAGCYLYGRHFNPTVYRLGQQMAALEDTESAYCTASGMSAIACAILASCESGDEIVAASSIYGGTYALLRDFLPRKANIRTRFVDVTDSTEVRSAISPKTRLIFTESITNPTLRIADIPGLAKIARRANIKLVVDNTFAPLILQPARHGADVVVHSLTKFIGGASDLIAGAVCGDASFIRDLVDLHTGPLMILGPTMDARIASEISLRIPHLPLRMRAHGDRALGLAIRLQECGIDVSYPGLPLHPDHDLLNTLRFPDLGYGGVLTINLGSEKNANALMAELQNTQDFGYMAVSLGYFDTLMSCSGSSTSSELTEADKLAAGISPGLLRISAGYTGSLEQRWSQLKAGLAATGLA